jgi:hypothetical protein
MSFPPHTSLTVQPTDRSVNGPYKTFVNSGSESRIRGNPGKKDDNLRHLIHSESVTAKYTHTEECQVRVFSDSDMAA